eukprot:CAMPEP_0173188512 /NCGR_PEP_ID=MMETSP1141-20130122/11294_1 /TAXON_ID=483371 /ORGANISM="non described non described, Strain CCMP2298" /LENGTH=59 /DNA_ID=CAMNT_0014112445 /DNA_START=328 /DNA_END=507 /DNA_ORIENTATION=+
MTWMTPLSQMISVVTTFASSTITPASFTVIATEAPLTVAAFWPFMVTTVSALTAPETTW